MPSAIATTSVAPEQRSPIRRAWSAARPDATITAPGERDRRKRPRAANARLARGRGSVATAGTARFLSRFWSLARRWWLVVRVADRDRPSMVATSLVVWGDVTSTAHRDSAANSSEPASLRLRVEELTLCDETVRRSTSWMQQALGQPEALAILGPDEANDLRLEWAVREPDLRGLCLFHAIKK